MLIKHCLRSLTANIARHVRIAKFSLLISLENRFAVDEVFSLGVNALHKCDTFLNGFEAVCGGKVFWAVSYFDALVRLIFFYS